MLGSKQQKETIKLRGNSAVGSVMTYKQVEELLNQGSNISPQKSANTVSELHRVCAALLDALNDKTLALAHQKKANKYIPSLFLTLK